jgi:hypothetical protein
VPATGNLRDSDSDRKFFRWLARLREACIQAKCGCDQGNPASGADELVALVKERGSLPYATKACEQLADVVKTLWQATDPRTGESPYDRHVERLAFQVVLCRHNIPLEEMHEAKSLIDARVTETLII